MWLGLQAVYRHCGFRNNQDRVSLGGTTSLPGGRPEGSGEGDSLSIGGYELSGGPGYGLESLGP